MLICPAAGCRTENDPAAPACVTCGTPLTGYVRLSVFPAKLFNQGLEAARHGKLAQARDCFAAVVAWCPLDLEARNALAQACYALGDTETATEHWQVVLSRSPKDALAVKGLRALSRPPGKTKDTKTKSKKKKADKKH